MIKFTINKSAFLSNLRVAKQAIGSKIAIPALSKFKIVVTAKGIELTASNGQTSIVKMLPVDDKDLGMLIESEGSILLEAIFFDSVISQLPDVTFELEEMENHQVLLRSGKSEITLKGQDADLYPRIETIQSAPFAKIEIGKLKQIFNEVAFAASTQESRPVLTGVHMMLIEHQILVVVATDSHRLSRRETRLESFGEDFEVVIPNRAVSGFGNIFSDDEEKVSIYLTSTSVLFKTETINFYSRLIEGAYPDTDRLIPEDVFYSLDLEFDVSELLHAMNRARLLTAGMQNGTVKLSVSDDKDILSVNSPEIGSSYEELNVLEKNGANLDISFNPQFIIDALKVVKEPTVRFRFISNVRPFIILPKEEGANFIQLITPIRTN
ncbi:MAG: DNA polymerase III subunit beta [Streptococcaceae bacterium]|jgi:DNA polymerase-3 subunit beta|nr:DNA polymerase III subunit beta [Streptococcaceae bacterium]